MYIRFQRPVLSAAYLGFRPIASWQSLGSLERPVMACCPNRTGELARRLRERNAAGTHDFAASEAEFEQVTSYFTPPATRKASA